MIDGEFDTVCVSNCRCTDGSTWWKPASDRGKFFNFHHTVTVARRTYPSNRPLKFGRRKDDIQACAGLLSNNRLASAYNIQAYGWVRKLRHFCLITEAEAGVQRIVDWPTGFWMKTNNPESWNWWESLCVKYLDPFLFSRTGFSQTCNEIVLSHCHRRLATTV